MAKCQLIMGPGDDIRGWSAYYCGLTASLWNYGVITIVCRVVQADAIKARSIDVEIVT